MKQQPEYDTRTPAGPAQAGAAGAKRLGFAGHRHVLPVFGSGWFGEKAEAFARFFGTPIFLGGQTMLVFAWIIANSMGYLRFDPYPFILLNLAFSVQAAYAAPLILLAQTRQADRDKALAQSDADHRDEVAAENRLRQVQAQEATEKLILLVQQNTELTLLTKQLSERIEGLTCELHNHIIQSREGQE